MPVLSGLGSHSWSLYPFRIFHSPIVDMVHVDIPTITHIPVDTILIGIVAEDTGRVARVGMVLIGALAEEDTDRVIGVGVGVVVATVTPLAWSVISCMPA